MDRRDGDCAVIPTLTHSLLEKGILHENKVTAYSIHYSRTTITSLSRHNPLFVTDAAYMAAFYKNRNVNNSILSGTYKSFAHIIGLRGGQVLKHVLTFLTFYPLHQLHKVPLRLVRRFYGVQI